MSSQTHAFIQGEGDAWWERNRDKVDYGPADPVLRAMETLPAPRAVLEIGCANGGRLNAIHRLTGAECFGVDPSGEAIEDGSKAFLNIELAQATADSLPFKRRFDLVIFGFCLYLLDRADLFSAVAETDRVLADGGHLLIYDFCPESPCSRPYIHLEGLRSYKMDYSALFAGNPAYRVVGRLEAEHETAVHIMTKSLTEAYPEEGP